MAPQSNFGNLGTMNIGLIQERKNPPDKRVPFTPMQVLEIQQRFPKTNVVVEQSSIRCFKDKEYTEHNIPVVSDMSNCDILMGIKEVPVEHLIEGKTYMIFSHTIKQQPYNRKFLQAVLKKNVRLIDYEALKDLQENRLVAFGRYAGMVGAYNGLYTYGKKFKLFSIRRAHECFDVNDLKLELRKINLPAIKIILTGTGRVAKGAMETLDTAGVRKVGPYDFLQKTFSEPVYVQLGSADYHSRKEGGHFNRDEFHTDPDKYWSRFLEFTKVADLLLAGAFWNPKAPVLFRREDMTKPEFRTRVIADITCDIQGSIPSTKRASSIADPIYDYDPITDTEQPPLSNDKFTTVMAIDNLPCELPRSASEEFGRDLIDRILRPLHGDDTTRIIERATIAANGNLTSHFEYLRNYVEEK